MQNKKELRKRALLTNHDRKTKINVLMFKGVTAQFTAHISLTFSLINFNKWISEQKVYKGVWENSYGKMFAVTFILKRTPNVNSFENYPG